MFSQSQYIFSEKYQDHEFSMEIQRIVGTLFGIKPKEHLEIMHDILEAVMNWKAIDDKSLNVTKAVYNEYQTDLLKQKFINDKNGKLLVTDKGKKFVKKYKTIKKFVNNFRL